ncbi:MAG: hypothetical protein NC917_06540 [Candidatus Omnitrophica bacterium]|nr:hypothetical protein [Candidatus Omnitrophota bacterium]
MREKIYLWAHKEGMQNNRWGLPKDSKITPVDACKYLGIENIIFVREFGKPEPEEYEFYAESFKGLKKVIWSVVGAGGTYHEGEIERIIELKKKYSNIVGAIMDDFFVKEIPPFRPEQIVEIKEVFNKNKIELWTVLYQHQLNLPIKEYLEKFDLITYWIWWSEGINKIDSCFEKFCEIVPEKRKALGIYMWDYGNGKEMPIELFIKEIEIGQKWINEKKIEGMIFLASCIVDLGLQTVEWLKKWIASL